MPYILSVKIQKPFRNALQDPVQAKEYSQQKQRYQDNHNLHMGRQIFKPSCQSFYHVREILILASTVVTLCAVPKSGFKSISAISGAQVHNAETLTMASVKRSSLTPSCPLTPRIRPYPFRLQIIFRASSRETGLKPVLISRSTSTNMPPRPHTTVCPNEGSFFAPIKSSLPLSMD